MSRRLISGGSEFEAAAGYSRAVVDGDWVFVSGTTGFDYAAGTIAEDIGAQARQTFRNIEWALHEAGVEMADVVRARYYLARQEEWPAFATVLGDIFGEIRPAATCVICALVDPRMKVEIEVTAKRHPSLPV